MALKQNINFNPSLPESATNQRFIFETPQVINQQTGQLSSGGYATPTITPSSLEPVSQLPFVNPNRDMFTPSFPTIPESTYQATPKETDISKLIGELTATTGLAGEKEAYRIEQEKTAGLEAMRASEADYTAQLRQLEADWKNIPMITAEEFTGRAGVYQQQKISEAEQRKLSIRANTVSALLAATQGRLTYAQSQVDRAVNAKYAVQEAERKAKLENLDLLLKDPTLTVEQKNRADKQLAIQKKAEEADKKKKEDSSTIMDWAVKAAANGATPSQAQAIANIAMSDNPDLNKAFALYQPFTKEEKILSVAEAKALGVPYGTTREAAMKMEIKPAKISDNPDKPLTINQIDIFRRNYNWTPPFGFTENQLLQFMKDNPTLTPEELEVAAKKAISGETSETKITETPEDIITWINSNMSNEQLKSLKKKADEAGISHWYTGKKTDVKNYLNSVKDKIRTAIEQGYTKEEILEFLMQ